MALLGGCGRKTAGAKEQRNLLLPDPVAGVTPPPSELLGWVRRDSELVIGVNVAQLRTSPIWHQELEPWLTAQLAATLPAMRNRCELDLLTSVETVAVGLRRFITTVEGSVVVRGPDPRKLWACLHTCREALRADGIDPQWDGDILSLRTARGNGVVLVGEDDGVIRGELGVEASTEELKKSAKKPPMLKASPGFLELYGQLDGNASGWFLLQGPLLQPAVDEHVMLRAVTGAITASASPVGGSVTLDVRLHTSTAERAVRYAGTANARLAPDTKAAFTDLTIAAEGDAVHLTAGLTLAQLLALMDESSRGGRSLAELLVRPPPSPLPPDEPSPVPAPAQPPALVPAP